MLSRGATAGMRTRAGLTVLLVLTAIGVVTSSRAAAAEAQYEAYVGCETSHAEPKATYCQTGDRVSAAESSMRLERRQVRLAPILALHLQLHQSIQGDGHRRVALDVDAHLADVPRDDAREPRGAPLILPREPDRD